MVYGMQKTTVYIPDDLKREVGRLAVLRGVTEAELVRQALRSLTAGSLPPRPRLPLFESGKPGLADDIDSGLAGFGET